MRDFLLIVLAIVLLVMGYGYWDAYSERSVRGDIRASVVSAWWVYSDTLPTFGPIENGQLFLRVSWEQPDEFSRISSIRIIGSVMDEDVVVARVDAPCQRQGDTWLGRAMWTSSAGVSRDLLCFVKINKVLQPTTNKPVNMDEAEHGIENMRISFTADVRAVNKPMRFVLWINSQAATFKKFVTAPFVRE